MEKAWELIGWVTRRAKVASLVLSAFCVTTCAHAYDNGACDHFGALLKQSDAAPLRRTMLYQTPLKGAAPGDESFQNIDLDNDDVSDYVSLGCSAGDKRADPCTLTVELSTGRKIAFSTEYFLALYKWHGRIYAIGSATSASAENHIYGFGTHGIRQLCTVKEAT